MTELALVAIAYNRPNSLNRLLSSLKKAEYPSRNVTLIISIDWSENRSNVYDVAENFEWEYGPKRIIKHQENLGLKKHVMMCGDLTEEYDALAVFEDDIYVSTGFYQFGMEALKYYKNADDIVGISLYTPEWNQTAERFFTVEENSYDTFFMKYASSWGQIWTRRWWNEFKEWLNYENDENFHKEIIPKNIQAWSDKSSWLKDHIKYCIEKEKYFIYPRISYTTNFSDVGEHSKIATPNYQVPLLIGKQDGYRFQNMDNSAVKYDAFFERENISQYLGINESEVTIDLYGSKSGSKSRYLLTTKVMNYKVIKSFGLKLRPQEINVVLNIEGNDIRLYDTKQKLKRLNNKQEIYNAKVYEAIYDVRSTTRKRLFLLTLYYYKSAIIRKVKKIMRNGK